MSSWIEPVIVVGGAVGIGLTVGWLIGNVFRRRAGRGWAPQAPWTIDRDGCVKTDKQQRKVILKGQDAGDGLPLNSLEHPPGLIDDLADAIRSGKLDHRRPNRRSDRRRAF